MKTRRFEVCSGYNDINIPVRKTKNSTGYDIEAAQTTLIPSLWKIIFKNLKLLSTTVGQLNDTQESGILMGTFSKTDEENNTYTTYGLYGVFQNNIIFELTDSGIARIALSDTSKTSQQLIDNIGVGYTVGSEIQPVYFANGIPKLGKTYVSLDNYNSQIKDLQDKNEELQTTITNLQTTITNLQTIITNLQKRVEILEKAKS